MEFTHIFKCLSDVQRLRILNLLSAGPLCVCHIQEILGEGQVKVSKQLRYMKELGVVEATREANWMIYSLPDPRDPLLETNLKYLLAQAGVEPDLLSDLAKRESLLLQAQKRDGGLPVAITCDESCPDEDCC